MTYIKSKFDDKDVFLGQFDQAKGSASIDFQRERERERKEEEEEEEEILWVMSLT